MSVSYDKLWKLMVDKKYTKMRLCKDARVSTNAMARMGKNEDIRLDTLVKICTLFGCTIDDIVEIVPNIK